MSGGRPGLQYVRRELYSNWLNYFVYQTTPFDLRQLPPQLERR